MLLEKNLRGTYRQEWAELISGRSFLFTGSCAYNWEFL